MDGTSHCLDCMVTLGGGFFVSNPLDGIEQKQGDQAIISPYLHLYLCVNMSRFPVHSLVSHGHTLCFIFWPIEWNITFLH